MLIMSWSSLLPTMGDAKVRRQIDKLFSREVLGAVIVGKFAGDTAALLITDLFQVIVSTVNLPVYAGTYMGNVFGIIATVILFIYWDIIEKRAQEQKEKVQEKKEKMTKENNNQTEEFV